MLCFSKIRLLRLFRMNPAKHSYLISLLLLLPLLAMGINELCKLMKRCKNELLVSQGRHVPKRDISKYERLLNDTIFRPVEFSKLQQINSFPDDYNGPYFYTEYKIRRYGLKPLTHIKPLLSDFGTVVNDISSFKFLLNPVSPISNNLFRKYCTKPFFAIIISAASNFVNRNIIRHTWIKDFSTLMNDDDIASCTAEKPASYAFLVAVPSNMAVQSLIETESSFYGDIIQINASDSYKNLTAKSAAMVYWALNYCNSAKFVLKVDDDIYINTYKLIDFAKELLTDANNYNMPVILGALTKSNTPVRDPTSKYYNSNETWPWSSYPNHLFGGVYIISQSALLPLMAAIQTTPYTLFEDIYITALCSRKARIEILSSERLLITKGRLPNNIDHCFVANGFSAWETITRSELLISHWMTHDLISMGKKYVVKNALNFCSVDNKVRDLFVM